MNTSARPELIGIAGSFASGKDTVAHALEADHGFTHVSTGDMVRAAAMKERGSVERPILREVADAHRHRDGAGVFVEHALEHPHPLVVTGIRSLGEAKAIKAAGGILLFIDAPAEIRYERMKARHRDAEVELTLEQFEENEAKEWYAGDDDADFNLRDIKAMADVTMDQVMEIHEFTAEVERRLGLAAQTV